jgi:hypothetical protein
LKEVMDMRKYLLVLDMDLLAVDEEHDLEPISYLVAKQEQEPSRRPVRKVPGRASARPRHRRRR